MSLSAAFEYCFPGAEQKTYCIRRKGADLMLCGRKFVATNGTEGFVPTVQPKNPDRVHGVCLERLEALR